MGKLVKKRKEGLNPVKKKYMKSIFPLIKLLGVANPETRSALLHTIDREAFHTICECVQNVVQNPNLITSSEERRNLREKVGKEKKKIRQFLNGKMSLKARRKKGVQLGGFLSAILSVAVPIIAELIFSKLSSK